jgi:hypothetical protein
MGLPPQRHVFDRVDQLGLFETSRDNIDAAFAKFHRANPDVYEQLVKYACQAKAAGRKRFGIKMLFERLRWYVLIETHDSSGLKLNNNYHSRYARLLMQQERCRVRCEGCARPRCLAGLFELRQLAEQ